MISVPGSGVQGYILLFASIAFESLGSAVLATLRESLVAIHVNPDDRSRVMALLQTTVMLVSVPFGYIGGLLSDIDRALPFVLNIGLLFLGIVTTTIFFRKGNVRSTLS